MFELMKVVVLENVHEKAVELLEEEHDVSFKEKDLEEAEAVVIRTYTQVNKDFLERAPKLRAVVRCGVGLENVDVDACEERGVQVFNSPGSNANAVAEFIIGLIINHFRRIVPASRSVEEGEWTPDEFMGEELGGKVLGLIGFGNTARRLAGMARGFGMEVIAHDPYLDDDVFEEHGVKKFGLHDLLESSDVVSVHIPLNEETRDLLTEEELDLMREHSLFINTSRGEVVDEHDLLEVLDDHLGGACLDVARGEPRINEELLSHERLLVTPHIAGLTEQSFKKMCVEAVRHLL